MKCPIHGVEFDPLKGEGCSQCLAEKQSKPAEEEIVELHKADGEVVKAKNVIEALDNADEGSVIKVQRNQVEDAIPEIIVDEFKGIGDDVALVRVKPASEEAVVKLRNQVNKAVKNAEVFVVDGEPAHGQATTYLAELTVVQKAIEEKRLEYTAPLNDHLNDINTQFKTLSQPMAQAINLLKDKIKSFLLAMQKKREEALAIQKAERELAERKAAQTGEPVERPSVTDTALPLPVTTHMRTEGGTSTLADNWQYRVINLDLIPRKYMIEDDAMLKAFAKKNHDNIEIPGIEFYNNPIVKSGK